MTAPDGKRLERLVAAIHHAESTGATVVWDETIEGRQFDVTVRFRYGIHTYLTVIECKDSSSSKVSVEKVDAFVTKARDAKANKAVLVSTRGFQSGCFAVAERHGVQLLVLTETSQTPVPELVAKIVPGMNIYDVKFISSESRADTLFEDWGGRLAYLMNHTKVILPTGTKNPNQLVNEWQLSRPTIELEGETHVELPLPPASVLQLPNEGQLPVSKMVFLCALVDVVVPSRPMPDNHILQAMSMRVELRDTKGVLHHSSALDKIPLGFNAPAEPGKFYELPSMFHRYHCDKIDGELVTWTLLESYQHGHLIQATFTQKRKYAEHYVEVTDSSILDRLRSMLARLRSK